LELAVTYGVVKIKSRYTQKYPNTEPANRQDIECNKIFPISSCKITSRIPLAWLYGATPLRVTGNLWLIQTMLYALLTVPVVTGLLHKITNVLILIDLFYAP